MALNYEPNRDVEFAFEFKGVRYALAANGVAALAKSLGYTTEKMVPILKTQLFEYLTTVAEDVADAAGTPWPGAEGSDRLNMRSGRSVRSIRNSVRVRGSGSIANVEGQVGGVGSLRIQEAGGTITAKNVHYLTIPLKAALDSRGVPLRKKARDWGRTYVITARDGKKYIVGYRGKKKVLLYMLKHSVTIEARLGMFKALASHADEFAEYAISRTVQGVMRGYAP